MKLKPEWIEAWEKVPMLHVHAQPDYHEAAHLVMNEAGKRLLVELLQREDIVVSEQFTPADGECYDLYVVTLPTEQAMRAAQEYTEVNTLQGDSNRLYDVPEVRAAMVEKAEKQKQAREQAADAEAGEGEA
ncbi:hypothetical protein KKE60_05210 [Patescibacteria group bacterium]|nr:hypothetical protein [Patescibacteria group bacterium]